MDTVPLRGRSAEIITLFEDSVLSIRRLRAGQRFCAGADVAADLAWPLWERAELIRVGPAGAIEIVAPSSMLLGIELLDEASQPVSETLCFLEEVDTGARVALLPRGRRARLQLGAVSLLVAAERPSPRPDLTPPIDLRDQAPTAAVALVFLIMLAGITALPPNGGALAMDPLLLSQRGVQVKLTPSLAPSSPSGLTEAPRTAVGSVETGDREPSRIVPGAGARGPSAGRPSRARAKLDAQDAAVQAGILGILRGGEGTDTGSSFGPGGALGSAGATMAVLDGALMGDATGALAIDRVSVRSSGSELGVGVGAITTRGAPYGRGPKLGSLRGGSGSSLGSLIGDSLGPIVACCGVAGRWPSGDMDAIRRAVRAQGNAFRFCYERQLQRNPDLSGRVLTRFWIAPNGHVVAAVTESSTMNDRSVEACVAEVFRRVQVPAAPDAGLLIVNYPLVFSKAGQVD